MRRVSDEVILLSDNLSRNRTVLIERIAEFGIVVSSKHRNIIYISKHFQELSTVYGLHSDVDPAIGHTVGTTAKLCSHAPRSISAFKSLRINGETTATLIVKSLLSFNALP